MPNSYEAIPDKRRATTANAETRHAWTFDQDGLGETVEWRGGVGTFGVGAQVGEPPAPASLGGGTVTLEWSGDDEAHFTNVISGVASVGGPVAQISVTKGHLRPRLLGSAGPGPTSFVAVLA